MSELLGMFGEGGDGGMVGLTVGGTFSEDSLSSLSSVPNKTLLLSMKTKIKCKEYCFSLKISVLLVGRMFSK